MEETRRPDDMTRKTPFFITASLLVATLALALPDLELETAAEEPVKGARMRGMAGAPHAAAAAETEP
jgi:hypothetical protein